MQTYCMPDTQLHPVEGPDGSKVVKQEGFNRNKVLLKQDLAPKSRNNKVHLHHKSADANQILIRL